MEDIAYTVVPIRHTGVHPYNYALMSHLFPIPVMVKGYRYSKDVPTIDQVRLGLRTQILYSWGGLYLSDPDGVLRGSS